MGFSRDWNVNLDREISERWFFAHTLSSRGDMASYHLPAQGFRIRRVRFPKTGRHTRKLREKIAPIFARCVFVGFNLDRNRRRSINGTFVGLRLLGTHGWPIPVPAVVVESLI